MLAFILYKNGILHWQVPLRFATATVEMPLLRCCVGVNPVCSVGFIAAVAQLTELQLCSQCAAASC